MPQTNEKAFETHVEEILLSKGGRKAGEVGEWDKELALFSDRVFSFIRATQEKLWSEMQALHQKTISWERRHPCRPLK